MSVVPFVPKSCPELPDHYSITIHYVDGKSETIEIASHRLIDKVVVDETEVQTPKGAMIRPTFEPVSIPYLELWSKDDLCSLVPMSSVKRIEFDSRFSKIVAIRSAQMQQPKP